VIAAPSPGRASPAGDAAADAEVNRARKTIELVGNDDGGTIAIERCGDDSILLKLSQRRPADSRNETAADQTFSAINTGHLIYPDHLDSSRLISGLKKR
jgi:hypothetical protein